MADQHTKEIAAKDAEILRLREALRDCLDEYSYAAEYKGEYLRKKHGDDERIAEWLSLLPKETL